MKNIRSSLIVIAISMLLTGAFFLTGSVDEAFADAAIDVSEAEPGLYIGSSAVTDENCFGEGWRYDSSKNELTLSNFNYSGEGISFKDSYRENCRASILSIGNVTIRLEGDSVICTEDGGKYNYGICNLGTLQIKGSGTLTVCSGSAEGEYSASEAFHSDSYSYYGRSTRYYDYSQGTINVQDSACIIASAGNAQMRSEGMSSYSLSACDHASITAAGGEANYSYGIDGESVSAADNAAIKASGAEADTSTGLSAWGCSVSENADCTFTGSRATSDSIGVECAYLACTNKAVVRCFADRRSTRRNAIAGEFGDAEIHGDGTIICDLTSSEEKDYLEDIKRPVDSGSCGENLSWYITPYYDLVIAGTGDMYDYGPGGKSKTPPWEISSNRIRTIAVLSGCTSIGNYAFADFGTGIVDKVYVADGVRRIGDYAMKELMTGAQNAAFALPRSLEQIGASAFIDNTCLSGNLETSSCFNSLGESAFEGCTDLRGIALNGSVDTIGAYAFANCKKLESLQLPPMLTDIGSNAFRNCRELTRVNMPGSVTSIGDSAFTGCRDLIEIIFEGAPPLIGKDVLEGCDANLLLTYDPSFSDWTTPDWNGYRTYPLHPHNEDGISVKPATINEEGRIDHICSVCGIWAKRDIFAKIDKDSLTVSDAVYTGAALKPAVNVQDSQKNDLIESEDYDVTYTNNINAGTGTAKVTFKGNYAGTLSADFTIKPKDLSGMTANLSTSTYTFDGAAKKPAVTISGLTSGTDFTVAYKNNTNAGKATVTITGKGNYCGSFSTTFTIKPADITKKTITLSATALAYTGKVRKPTVKVSGLTTADYTVTYSNASSKNVGTYKVTVKGKRNYTGSKTLSYKINPKATTISKLTAGSKCFTVKWAKVSAQATGYQIQYSTSSTFARGNKTVKITSYSTTSKKVSSLTAKKKYYVRIRTYKTVGSTTYYSAWSAKKAVTTLK